MTVNKYTLFIRFGSAYLDSMFKIFIFFKDK